MPETKNKNVFEETIKVVKIAQRLEAEARKEIPDDEKLRMVEKAKEGTRNEEEFEELLSEEKRLKRRLRFPGFEKVEIPQDKKKMVEENYKIEMAEAKKLLEAKYRQLENYRTPLSDLVNLLNEIIFIEDQAATANKLELVVAGNVEKDPGSLRGFAPALQHLTKFSHGPTIKQVKETVEKAEKMVAIQSTAGIKRNVKGAE